jgi:hypothetical protein
MYILLSIGLLLLAGALMVVLRIWRPGFGYHWLVASAGGFLAWLLVLFSYTRIPESLQILSWGPRTSYTNSIILSLDEISWPFAAALVTLLMATLLSDVVRAYDLSWSNWASSLMVIAIGLVGIFAENLLTFVLVWMAYDIFVLVMLLLQQDAERMRRRTVRVFFMHLLGTLCLLFAGAISASDNSSVLLQNPTSRAIIFIVLAAVFRLGALPIDSQMQENVDNRRSFGTIRSLASMSIVAILVVRVAGALENVDLAGPLWSVLFFMVGLIGVLFSLVWFNSREELAGRQAWIMGFGMLIIASMLRAELQASMSWSLAAIYSGGVLFLASVRKNVSLWITMLGVISISTLPFSAAWTGLELFSPPYSISFILFFTALVLIISGYLRLAYKVIPEPEGLERWIRVVYPMGLIMLPIVHLVIGLLYIPDIGDIPIVSWAINLLIVVFTVLGFLWRQRGGQIPATLSNGLNDFLSLGWLTSLVQSVFSQVTRFLIFTSRILEGEGGILWVMLSIVLMLAILILRLGN